MRSGKTCIGYVRLWTAVAAALVSGTACNSEESEAISSLSQELTTCAAGAVTLGVDVSSWQGTVDWTAVKASGKQFASVRVAAGTTFDSKFDANWSGASSVGLLRGAYLTFDPAQDPTAQANAVISKVGLLGAGDLPVIADVELSNSQSQAAIASALNTWVSAVQAGTGKTPIIQTGKGFWNTYVNSSAFGNLPLWIAHYDVTCPNIPDFWTNWTFWQNSCSATVGGIAGQACVDQFNGDLSALQALAAQSPVGASGVVSSCAQIKQKVPTATNGNYNLVLGGSHNVSVYCSGMGAGQTPVEYLNLLSTAVGANISTYGIGPNCSGGLSTSYTKVRFYPADLTVDTADTQFSTSTGVKTFGSTAYYTNKFADAGDCRWLNSATGKANVDLTGTALAVATNQFSAQGWYATGTAMYTSSNQVVKLTGGGYCGEMTVAANSRLKLTWK